MKRLLAALLALWIMMTAPGVAGAEAAESPEALAQRVLEAIIAGDCGWVVDAMDDSIRGAVSQEGLEGVWGQLESGFGAYRGVVDSREAPGGAVLTLDFEGGALAMSLVLNGAGRIVGLSFVPAQKPQAQALERTLPEGVREEPVTLFAGEDRALNGMLTLPEGEAMAIAVLIQGSGPSDMDETVAANKPQRDLAWDLAALGVGSLRFDKITYAHPELAAQIPTVKEEYLDSAAEALRLVRERVGAARVILVGHSQGGMLMPWLVSECGYDGGVALAGTPLPLWWISYEQNLALIDLMPEETRAENLALVEQMRAQAEGLSAMSDEEAAAAQVFGMDAAYLKYMGALDEIALARACQKPMLFAWGEADAQVSRQAFEAWREGLGDDALYTYITYPGLNHLFFQAREGENIANIMDSYAVPGAMDARVAGDIAAWIEALA